MSTVTRAANATATAASAETPLLVVFGGSGYIGSHICRAAVKRGIHVRSVSRSGAPHGHVAGDWIRSVEWLHGDLFQSDGDWKRHLHGAHAIISCIGGFGKDEWMTKINGDTNINAIRAAKALGVPRAVFVSVYDYKLPSFVLNNGYFRGKRDTESVVHELYGSNGIILKPAFVYGSRHVGLISLPLQLIGSPLKWLTSLSPIQALNNIPVLGSLVNPLIAPPVSADDVANAAIDAALDTNVKGTFDTIQISQGILHKQDKKHA